MMIKDYDNDDDLDEGHVQPLLEMSQDCIVEWNESQNVSDFATTPIPESSSRGTIGLEDVRRNLDVETNDKGDEEINAFFHLLRKEHEGSPVVGTSPSRVATQRTKNTHKVESYIERPKKTSLASRRRRRQQQSNTVSNKRPHRIEPTGTVETICKTPPPNITEGAFDSLLKQLKQSAEQISPQPTVDKEISTLVLSTSNCSNSPLKEIAIVLPDARKETAPLDTQELIHKHAISGTIEKTSQQVEKQVRSIAVTATSQPSDGLPRLAARPDDLPTSHPSESTTNKALLPATSIITEASTRVPYNNDDDEFGNFAFDDIDMTCLDNLLSVKSSQHVTIHTEKDSGPSKSASTSEYSLPHASTKVLRDKGNQLSNPPGLQIEPKPTVRTLSQQPIIDDEFGEFPDFDFEVVEQAIANRQQTSDPLHNEVIQNPRNQSIDPSGLLHIKFSRYKVIQSEQDSIHFRKTLLIAEWTDEMRREHEEETKIHRNCQVEVIPDDGKQESQPVNLQRRNNNYPPVGHLQLRGQWYYTAVEEGDIIHICSLAGRYRTDSSALPLVLHSHPPVGSDLDDLVIVHHPDLLMTPTVISETVSCPRRAVFKQRNGSTGLTSKSALIGTLRHALFGVCMKERNFEKGFVVRQTKKIVRENADAMLGCGVTTADAEKQLIDTLPILLDFVKQHTTFMSPATDSLFPNTYVHGHVGGDKGVRFVAHATYSIEEPVVSPELALKGYVDAVLETTIDVPVNENDPFQLTITGLKHSLMALELKTGHNQASQHTHMGQLSLYTLMLQGRYGVRLSSSQTRSKQTSANKCKPDPEGAASGGLLLYLNEQSSKATHVAPEFDEFKSLIGQRNIIAAELVKSSRPRGVLLRYEEDKSKDEGTDQIITLLDRAPPVQLPDVQQSEHSCTRCFENRTCMLYARSEIEISGNTGVRRSHVALLNKFTGQLKPGDLDYFRKWDRLIDMEAHATQDYIATAWLLNSREREMITGETISSLLYDGASPSSDGSGALLRFRRASSSFNQTQLDSLSIGKGSHVIISTDGSVFEDSQSDPKLEYINTQRERKKFRHQMCVVQGFLEEASADEVIISAKRDDLDRVRGMCNRFKKFSGDGAESALTFRVDKDNSAIGIGTLRQNLINLFTSDHARNSNQELTQLETSRQRRLPRLRDFIVRLDPPSFGPFDDRTIFRAVGPSIPGCKLEALSDEFHKLNGDQKDAIRKVMSAKDYTLIQGLPGTGKTSTLAFIARLLAARGKRVLITSYTNAAVDNVVIKLLESGVGIADGNTGLSKIVRVGPRYSCHEMAKSVHVDDVATHVERIQMGHDQNLSLSQSNSTHLPCAESLGYVMSAARIVCSTVLTVPRSPLLANESFDVVIVDEAGQTSQPAILGALMAADTFVLVGDHKQLPPLVNSEIAQAGGYGESLLMKLAENHPTSVAPLTYQYRMNEEICKLSSYLIYGGKLKCGNEDVRRRKLDLPGFPAALPLTISQTKGLWPWLKMTVSPDYPVIFVDTDNIRKKPNDSKEMTQMEPLEEKTGASAGGRVTNPMEAILVRYIIHGLVATGASTKDIGVISPFRAQVQHLDDDSSMAEWKRSGLEISTIDRYQGRDKSVIILSFVRSNLKGNTGRLLQDKRRLNVALTRAKCKLIMVGSFSTLKSGSVPLRPLLGRINSKGQRQLLPENALDCYQIPYV